MSSSCGRGEREVETFGSVSLVVRKLRASCPLYRRFCDDTDFVTHPLAASFDESGLFSPPGRVRCVCIEVRASTIMCFEGMCVCVCLLCAPGHLLVCKRRGAKSRVAL